MTLHERSSDGCQRFLGGCQPIRKHFQENCVAVHSKGYQYGCAHKHDLFIVPKENIYLHDHLHVVVNLHLH